MLSEHLLNSLARPVQGLALPLHRRLYEAMRQAILDGQLGAGDRLPSSRELAQDLGLSRNTVVAALEQLMVEGYLRSRVGSGTYVHEDLPLAAPCRPAGPSATVAAAQQARLSQRGERLVHHFRASDCEIQPFTPGPPDFSAFPLAIWQRLQNQHWRKAQPELLDYNDSGGHGSLRRAVADHLRVFRGAQLRPDQVLITSGTQQSLALCAQLLADPGDTVWLEDPAYWGAVKALEAASLRLQPVPVDGDGMVPPATGTVPTPRLIYLTPSHQYPTGAVMPLARRQQLLATASTHGAWVLEDDYDSEFRFSGPPVASLQGLDSQDRVLYLGTFSKVLYPGIKLGYLVVPRPLVAAFRGAHYDLNRPGQMALQAALAEFMDMGHFAAALRRARHTYAERRQALVQALAPVLASGQAQLHGAAQGLHLCLRLPPHCDDRALCEQLAREGLSVRALSSYCLQRQDLRGLLVGYGYAPTALIERYGPLLAQRIGEAVLAAPEAR